MRDVRLDLIKSIAIVGVVLIHVAAPAFSNYAVGESEWIVSTVFASLLRCAVPLFLMASGALFLDPDREVTTRKIYTKTLPRIILALFVWAAAYAVYALVRTGFTASTIISSVKSLILFKHHFHLYYLHIILLFYVLVPILRVFTVNATKNQLAYALGVWIVLGIVYPFLRTFHPFTLLSGIPVQYAINLTYSAVGYALLGYFLKKYPLKKSFSLLYVLGLAITLAGTIVLSIHRARASAEFFEALTPGVLLMAIGIYTFAMHSEIKKPSMLIKISKASFCIYLVHDFFNIALRGLGYSATKLLPLASIPVITIVVLALSWAVYFVLSKIPIVNKYLI